MLSKLFGKKELSKPAAVTHKAADVGAFYNETNEQFIKVYGEVIQAFRTKDPDKLLAYEATQMGLKEGQRLLDAGCGIATPACYFSKNYQVKVDACTISSVQYDRAKQNIIEKGQEQSVTLHLCDYHDMRQVFGDNQFDKICFLESFGHSPNKVALLEASWHCLKPGGELYIKDLFRRLMADEKMQERVDQEINKINKAYRYEIASLEDILQHARKLNFIPSFVKTLDIAVDDFENLAISNEFQELTGIAKIETWENYIFPVDFFEIKFYKPVTDISQGLDKYFLQNMLYAQKAAQSK
jgi:cyclopropane fatty-acyl-phospholipid synthase-like methyltransferase